MLKQLPLEGKMMAGSLVVEGTSVLGVFHPVVDNLQARWAGNQLQEGHDVGPTCPNKLDLLGHYQSYQDQWPGHRFGIRNDPCGVLIFQSGIPQCFRLCMWPAQAQLSGKAHP